MNDINKVMGERILVIREYLGYSQLQMAAAINVNRNSYRKYEQGDVAISVKVLNDIAEVAGIDITWFFNPHKDCARELLLKRLTALDNNKLTKLLNILDIMDS